MSKTIVATAPDSGFRAAPAPKHAAMTPASSRHRRVGGPARPENHVIVLFGATGDLIGPLQAGASPLPSAWP
jgi:hypothetical protein